MPTPLPTLASPTDLGAPAVTPRPAAKPAASEPSFSETLRDKRRPVSDDGVAGPAPRGEAADASPNHSGETEAAPTPAASEARDTGQPTGALAHETPANAQSLPRNVPGGTAATGPPTGIGTDLLQTGVQTGEARPEPAPPEPVPTPDAAATPSTPRLQSSLTPAVQQAAPPRTGDVQPQLPPNPTPQTSSGIPAAGDGQTQAAGTGADTRSGAADDHTGAHHPATGRAQQVQAGVTVHNATGQSPLPMPAVSVTTPTQLPAPGLASLGLEDAPDTSARVVRGLTAMLNQRGGVMTMRLEPPALGQLRVQMTVARGAVTAQFQPATIEAQALLERSLATLRLALESQGLSVERLTVHAAPAPAAGREAAEYQSQQQQQQASRHQPDAGDGRSRGRGDEQPQDGRQRRRGTTHFAEAFENTGAKAA